MADQRPPDPQKYPKWLYKGGKSELVENEKEEKALGAGWSNNPAGPTPAAPAPEAPKPVVPPVVDPLKK